MISDNTLKRLCKIYGILKNAKTNGIKYINSSEIASKMNSTPEVIRKDLSLSGLTQSNNKLGYNIEDTLQKFEVFFNSKKIIKACIVGLGRIGSALLNYKKFKDEGFEIVAGFDKNVNKIERLKTDINVYPSYQLKDIISSQNIKLGIIAVPEESAQEIAQKLVDAGIEGILNFSALPINIKNKNVIVSNIDFTSELRFIAYKMKNKEE